MKNEEMKMIGGNTMKAKMNPFPLPRACSRTGGSANGPKTNLAPSLA